MSENVTTDHFIVKKKEKKDSQNMTHIKAHVKIRSINYTVAFFIGSKEHLG